jgi:hypothetical protein
MNWKPISAMPAELRDGRKVLLYSDYYAPFVVAQYLANYWTVGGFYCEGEFTHYCEITKPEVRDGE